MSQEVNQTNVGKETQQLLDGPLKHVRAAALAAALVPLASVLATPASAQNLCASSSAPVCGFVFNDVNQNGIQDVGEVGVEGAKVSLYDSTNALVGTVDTGPDGIYTFSVSDGTYTVKVLTPSGLTASPPNAGGDEFSDSDGSPDGFGNSVATNVVVTASTTFRPAIADFGFFGTPSSTFTNPGTGTPGYWKNHPDAWPVNTIVVGGRTYTKEQAIDWLKKVGKDKTTTMFASLVCAMLNVMIENDNTCVQSTIDAANIWMQSHPVGSNVAGSSPAWQIGEPLHKQMDAYNNGLLCAPHRQ